MPIEPTKLPPLTLLNGNQTQLNAVVHKLNVFHIVRDIVFLFGFSTALTLVCCNYILEPFFLFVGFRTSLLMPIITYSVIYGGGCVIVAGWGRQPRQVRVLRLLLDAIVIALILGKICDDDGIIAFLTCGGVLIAGAIGFVISFITAPYVDVMLPAEKFRSRFL